MANDPVNGELNPPAFPSFSEINGKEVVGSDGMTLRDWYASQAMIGLFIQQGMTTREPFTNTDAKCAAMAAVAWQRVFDVADQFDGQGCWNRASLSVAGYARFSDCRFVPPCLRAGRRSRAAANVRRADSSGSACLRFRAGPSSHDAAHGRCRPPRCGLATAGGCRASCCREMECRSAGLTAVLSRAASAGPEPERGGSSNGATWPLAPVGESRCVCGGDTWGAWQRVDSLARIRDGFAIAYRRRNDGMQIASAEAIQPPFMDQRCGSGVGRLTRPRYLMEGNTMLRLIAGLLAFYDPVEEETDPPDYDLGEGD